MNYSYAKAVANEGRTLNGGDLGKKVGNNTWYFDRGDYVALRYHSTDIVQYWPDHVVLSGAYDSVTTIQRFHHYSPFRIDGLGGTKYARYLADYKRVHLQGVPYLGLDFADGIKADYMGRWLGDAESYTTRVSLPHKGMRRAFTNAKRELAKRVRPTAAIFDFTPVRYGHPGYTHMLGLVDTLVNGGTVDQDDVVDTLEIYGNGWETVLSNLTITDSDFVEARNVPILEAQELLDRRAPEWDD